MNSIIIFQHIEDVIYKATQLYNIKFKISLNNNIQMGTMSSNFILLLRKKIDNNKINEIIDNIKNNLNNKWIKNIEILNDFFNITVNDEVYQIIINNIINSNDKFFIANNQVINFKKHHKNINFELGSINPTGPIHLGHLRSIIVALCLSNLYKSFDIPVYKEFFLNDCGNQINEFLKSIYMRWQINQGIHINQENIPYKGDYIKDLIPLVDKNTTYDDFSKFLPSIIETVKNKTINQLQELGVYYDNVVYESQLRKNFPLILQVFNDLINKKLIAIIDDNEILLDLEKDYDCCNEFIDIIPNNTVILLTKNLNFEKNKIIMKNGQLTYFGSDIIYLYHKKNRGFLLQYCFLGEDHIGHLNMLESLCQKLFNDVKFIPKKVGFVKVFNENKEIIPMSKRQGKFLSMEESKKIIGLDFLKIIMISRTINNELIFQIYNPQQQNLNNNCLFYIQYCYARISSVLKKFSTENSEIYNQLEFSCQFKYTGIILPQEYYILRQLFWMDQCMNHCLLNQDVNGIYQWIYNLASYFHTYFNAGSINHEYKFITNNIETTKFRIKILLAVKKSLGFILKNIISIEPLESM
jgi:arginyl-tRNA synthetase